MEGRVKNGRFHNRTRRVAYRPRAFAQPATEEEIVKLVKSARSGRVFGSAHSFNPGIMCDDTPISLDRYSGVLWGDWEKKQMAVRAGTRVRDMVTALLEEGWAFAALPNP